MTTDPIRLSIIVPTYNERDNIPELLIKLEQALSGISWELIVVDNGSRDTTPGVTESFAGRLPIRRLWEPVAGLARARNVGLRAAAGALAVFIDDDEQVAAKFLLACREGCEKYPDADYFGGRINPQYERAPAPWFEQQVVKQWPGIAGRYDLGDHERKYTEGVTPPFGGNLDLV